MIVPGVGFSRSGAEWAMVKVITTGFSIAYDPIVRLLLSVTNASCSTI